MKPRICFCAESLVWIAKHLKKSARAQFHKMILKQKPNLVDVIPLTGKRVKKRRTAKQIRATKKLIAFNKRRRARR